MEWAEFTIDLATKLVWLAIAVASLALTFWQLWDIYGFRIQAWVRSERKAHAEYDAWKVWALRLWNNTRPEGVYGG
jgi:hypothetical protein